MSEGPEQTAAIIYTTRGDLRDAVKAELRALQIGELFTPSDRDNCVETLVQNPTAVLILDWEVGLEPVNVVLAAAKGHFRIETRPIFLIATAIDESVVAVGAEYAVSRVHTGPVSRLAIKESLDALFDAGLAAIPHRQELIKVAHLREKGEWQIATDLLLTLVDSDPADPNLVLELAENFIHQEEWDKASTVLLPLGAQDPVSIRALHLLGRCFLKSGEPDKAVEYLQKAKIINPANVERLIDLGHAFLHLDQVEDAMLEFATAERIDPENKEAKVGKSQCLLLGGDVNEALTLLRSISGPREMASIFNTAAVLSMRGKHFEKGMSLYRAALKALGEDAKLGARLMFNMGLGYRRWHKTDKALACFEKALSLDPSYAKAQTQIAEIKEQGRHDAPSPVSRPEGSEPSIDEESLVSKPARPLAKAAGAFDDTTDVASDDDDHL